MRPITLVEMICLFMPSFNSNARGPEFLNLGQGHRRLLGRPNSREQQEIVTLSLQLLQNCLMLINTILVERTIEPEGLWGGQFAIDLNCPSFP